MLQIQNDVDLSPFNTFNVRAFAKSFAVIHDIEDLRQLSLDQPFLVIGEGANVLFTKDFDGLIIKNEINKELISLNTNKEILFEVSSGVNWHQFVMNSVSRNLSGVENLAYIPGTVGAAPVQNIAAYGQTAGEAIYFVKGWNLNSKSLEVIQSQNCNFYYRDSIFKHELKNKFIISSVVFKLSKIPKHDTNYHGRAPYESLAGELAKFSKPPYSSKAVAEAVTRIRQIKLPDWHKAGTAGSFFKNPFVSNVKFLQLQKQMPDLQVYPVDQMLYPNPNDPVFKMSNMVKIPAGRLLDELRWKGKRIGNVGTFEKHALVIVNQGGATGQEILDFSQMMKEDVKKNFEIELESEVNVIT